MAESMQRVTRSSSRGKGRKTEGTDKTETFAQLEMADLTPKKSVKCDDNSLGKCDKTEGALPVTCESCPSGEKFQTKKVKSTRKKRPSSEDEPEKENKKLSKHDVETSDMSNNDIHSKKMQIKSIESHKYNDDSKTNCSKQSKKSTVTSDSFLVKSDISETAPQIPQPCEDHQPKNVKSTRKKRPSSEDETEKENKKLSKNIVDASDTSNVDNTSAKKTLTKFMDNDTNNNQDETKSSKSSRESVQNDWHISTSDLAKKLNNIQVKPNSPLSSPFSLSELPVTNFSKACGLDLDLFKKAPSRPGAIIPVKSRNIYHQYFNSALGKSLYHNSLTVTRKIASHLSNYEVVDNDHPFRCRLTSIEWHPRMRNFLAAGSKHGDMVFYKIKQEDYSRLEVVQKFKGIGAGGNISGVKFHPTEDNLLYTSSLCGKVCLKDLEGLNNRVLLDTMSLDFWYSSLDVHKTEFLVCAGRNKGHACLLDRDGDVIWEKRLHTNKISHIEFSPLNPNMIVTASLDHTVRFWDIRKVVDKSPTELLFHNNGLNSAYFSLTDGCRLLTTDQKDELRVYKAPLWNLERTISHPHRFFQHLTPIKAYWHPSKDIIICGRYPDTANMPHFANLRCIDMIDASSGESVGELKDSLYDGIISLTKLNQDGTKLASAMGYNLNLWNIDAAFITEDLTKEQVDRFKASQDRTIGDVRARGRDGSLPRLTREDDDDVDRGSGKKGKQTTATGSRTAQATRARETSSQSTRETSSQSTREETQERGRRRERRPESLTDKLYRFIFRSKRK